MEQHIFLLNKILHNITML